MYDKYKEKKLTKINGLKPQTTKIMLKTTSMANYSHLILRPLALGSNHGRPVLMIFLFFMMVSSSEKAAAQNLSPPPPEFSQSPPRVDLKMAIVMVLLVTMFFILGFLSVYTHHCAQDRFWGRLDLGFGGPSPSGWVTDAGGLDPDVIGTFPTFVYSTVKGHKIGNGALECAVCLNEFEDSETLRLIPKCDHVFHPDCIDPWLVSHSTCPVCRANLVPKPGDVHPHTLAEIFYPVHYPVGPDHVSVDTEQQTPNREEESPEVRLIVQGVDQSRPPRARSTGFGPRSTAWRSDGMLPRSHSTGRLLGRPGGSHERFTLRLPEDVRNQLVNASLERAKSTGAGLPRVGSSRRGYRTGSRKEGSSYYERFEPGGRADRWFFSVMSPFVSRTGSVRSMKGMGGDDAAARSKAASAEQEKPPLDRMFDGREEVGERSSDPLRPGNDV